jgi:hypothetical protein
VIATQLQVSLQVGALGGGGGRGGAAGAGSRHGDAAHGAGATSALACLCPPRQARRAGAAGGGRKRRHPGFEPDADGGAGGDAGRGGARDQRPDWWGAPPGLRPERLADALAGAAPRRATLHAQVCTVPASAAAPAALSPAAPVVHLDDGSAPAPAPMFLHSSLAPAAGGPLLAPGARLRCAAVVAAPPPGCGALPRLMPTTALVAELPRATWERLGAVEATPLGRTAPVVGLRDALARAARGGGGGGCMEGWLSLRVSAVGTAEPGGGWGARVVRAVAVCDAGDAGGAAAASGGGGAGVAGGEAAAAGGSGGQEATTVPLILRDEEQAALGGLLAPGEHLALLGAVLQEVEGPQPGPGGGSGGGRRHFALLLGERFMVAAPQDACSGGERGKTGAAQPPDAAVAPAVLPPLASVRPGASGLVLWGRVRELAAGAGGRALSCMLEDCGSGSAALPLRLELSGGPRSKVRVGGCGACG